MHGVEIRDQAHNNNYNIKIAEVGRDDRIKKYTNKSGRDIITDKMHPSYTLFSS